MAHVYRRSFAILSVSILLMALPGCEEEGPQGPAGPVLTGDLIGYTILTDLYGSQVPDRSGVTVTAEGTTISAVSDSTGRWVLTNLPTGTYTIAYSKTGYGTRKGMGYQFVGGGQTSYGTTFLYQIPGFTVTGLSAAPSGDNVFLSLTLTGVLPTATNKYVQVFIGTSAGVSSDPANYRSTFSLAIGSASTTFSGDIPSQSYFHAYGFSAGQTAYVVAYAMGYGSGSYLDLETGRYWYSSLNPIPSNVDTVAVP